MHASCGKCGREMRKVHVSEYTGSVTGICAKHGITSADPNKKYILD